MSMGNEPRIDRVPKLQSRLTRRRREANRQMFDGLSEDCGYERKYGIKLLRGDLPAASGRDHLGPERRSEAVDRMVQQIWVTFEQQCRKRLAPNLRQWLPYYEIWEGKETQALVIAITHNQHLV